MINLMGYGVIYLSLAIFIFYKSEFLGFKKTELYKDPLALDVSNSLKGIFAVVVVVHHLSLHYYNDRIMLPFMQLGKYAVSVFFLLSGFGLMYCLLHKKDYIKGFIPKRLSKILVPSVLAAIIYLIIYRLTGTGDSLNILNVILGKSVIVLYSWYVYQIILVYVIFFIVFKLIKNIKAGLIVFSLCIAVDMFLFVLLGYDLYWSIGIICVALGSIAAFYYNRIIGFFEKHYYPCFIIIGALFAVAFVVMAAYLQEIPNKGLVLNMVEMLETNLSAILFCLLVILATMKMRFVNKATRLLGKISYEIYLYHGIIVVLMTRIKGLPDSVICMLVIIASVACAYLMNLLTSKIFQISKKS